MLREKLRKPFNNNHLRFYFVSFTEYYENVEDIFQG